MHIRSSLALFAFVATLPVVIGCQASGSETSDPGSLEGTHTAGGKADGVGVSSWQVYRNGDQHTLTVLGVDSEANTVFDLVVSPYRRDDGALGLRYESTMPRPGTLLVMADGTVATNSYPDDERATLAAALQQIAADFANDLPAGATGKADNGAVKLCAYGAVTMTVVSVGLLGAAAIGCVASGPVGCVAEAALIFGTVGTATTVVTCATAFLFPDWGA